MFMRFRGSGIGHKMTWDLNNRLLQSDLREKIHEAINEEMEGGEGVDGNDEDLESEGEGNDEEPGNGSNGMLAVSRRGSQIK